MTGIRKGLTKVEVALRWDPSPAGTPPHDLDLVAAVYDADAPHGPAAYLVHFANRSPDGTVTLDRDSRTGQGFGYDEVMTLELHRMDPRLRRVVIGVVIQGRDGKTFADIPGTGIRIRADHTDLATDDLTTIPHATAATIAEFTRDDTGTWTLHAETRGHTTDPDHFPAAMGTA
ncbi:TerD family protein [Streptomyces sp. NPDC093225]|uniref:TerD family protein n=1 Tax=Streptomyces sp. NPDC093225 TaxID=3366034 RepID=UPI00382E33EB